MYQFDYVRARSISEAASALSAHPDAKLLAGGQTLIPTMKQRLASPSHLIDLSAIAELKSIRVEGTTLVIGATATHADVARNPDVRSTIPALAKLAEGIGDAQVRHCGTIGGSVANNDPAADYPAAVLALNAIVVTNQRQFAVDDFFNGMFATALQAGELITEIRFPVPAAAGYAKFEQRASRYALVGAFVAKTASGVGAVRVAVTGAGSNGVFRPTAIEKALSISFTKEAAASVKLDAEGMLADLHGSAEYRAALVSVMTARAVAAAG